MTNESAWWRRVSSSRCVQYDAWSPCHPAWSKTKTVTYPEITSATSQCTPTPTHAGQHDFICAQSLCSLGCVTYYAWQIFSFYCHVMFWYICGSLLLWGVCNIWKQGLQHILVNGFFFKENNENMCASTRNKWVVSLGRAWCSELKKAFLCFP